MTLDFSKLKPAHERPLASSGLTSYRYKGRYGWVMIGALDTADALNEARRTDSSYNDISKLQIWDGTQYVPVEK